MEGRGEPFALDEDFVGVTKEGWMGEVTKVPDPGIGCFFILPEERCRQSGASASKVNQTVIFPSFARHGFLELGEVHVSGEILMSGIEKRMGRSLMIPKGHQCPARSGG